MSGYGLLSAGANSRITETGAVKVPLLRHCPQVRVSSVGSIAPRPLPSFLTLTIVSHSCPSLQENAPTFSKLRCYQGLASLRARLRKAPFCGTASAGRGRICSPLAVLPIDGHPTGTPRAARPGRRRGEPARRRGGRRRRRLLRAARRLQRPRPSRQLRGRRAASPVRLPPPQ